jgi:hypothetical protein
MKTRLMTQLTGLILVLEVGGCASIRRHSPYESRLPSAAGAKSNHVYREAAPETAVERPKKSATGRTTAVRQQPAAGRQQPAATQSPPAPAEVTTVTTEDNDADHVQAQSLIDDANTRLAQIDRSKLTGENVTAYDEANNLANAARKAMVQHDYLAATGLARKAVLVTAQVASHTPSR